MEASQPLSIESFSYSWLVNRNPSAEITDGSVRASLDASEEAYFIEMDPRFPSSKSFRRNSISYDFKFDFPTSQPPLPFVHADEVFRDGYVLPFFVDPLKLKSCEASNHPTSSPPPPVHVKRTVMPESKLRSPSLRQCRRLSRRIFRKYLHLFRPLVQMMRGRGTGPKAEETRGAKSQAIKNSVHPVECSPRISSAYSADEWRRSCDSESSIYEAVLHCKRSIGR
ncbi:probable membrane-associated kinase regulator 6 [Rhodamnia argentea]|uniref:Probable membrane-associated kinase regulator 6 n=1 Tax=Rhodamnia argentea TaxID=178133 RepID=A0A8B8QQN1_9MYRT|nr:probable membrane-associated kinase regulator 6 [Rhodamnia argentea]XP_048127263.1 probable membrane-associated kinase regulator 6 [Rhodamnia argentea]XP_048127264.1 probable membrane-associated kinase regulator 6 [Rhodamnia argentea]